MIFQSWGYGGRLTDGGGRRRGDPAGRAGRRARLPRPLARRAPLRRLLVLSRQHGVPRPHGGAHAAHPARHRRGDPAVERPAARRGEDRAARPPLERPGAVRDGPGPGPLRVRRLRHPDGRVARPLRRVGPHDPRRARDRLHRGRRSVLPPAPHADPARARAFVRRPHLLRGHVARLGAGRGRPRRPHGGVQPAAVGDQAAVGGAPTASGSSRPTAASRARRWSATSSTATPDAGRAEDAGPPATSPATSPA